MWYPYYRDLAEYTYRRQRTKTDWAGIGPADAFKANLDYYVRLPAQRLAYRLFRNAQRAAARLADGSSGESFTPNVQPQLGPSYTTYPASLSIHASVGLTAYLEFESRVAQGSLLVRLQEYLANPAEHDQVDVDPDTYQKLVTRIAQKIQTRLLLEDLARHPALEAVELYRLFAASQQDLRFRSALEILDAVILYGEIVPEPGDQRLHPFARALLETLERTCEPFLGRIPETEPHALIALGEEWVPAIGVALAPYLSPSSAREVPTTASEGGHEWAWGPGQTRFTKGQAGPAPTDWIPPLDDPAPPTLFEPPSALELAGLALTATPDASEDQSQLQTNASPVPGLLDTFAKASGQHPTWEDMRFDLVEHALRESTFAPSPIEGNPTDGHEVRLRLGGGEEAGGEIHDRPVRLSGDDDACQKLVADAEPITRTLSRVLYPNLEPVAETVRLCASGSLDPARMALARFAETVFRRYRVREVADRRGRPVLLLACDGSGSLRPSQMKMAKLLACAWLRATAQGEVQVLAGLYHSGQVRRGVSGPLVQWIYHPQKTSAVGRKDAARAIVSLPGTGTGVQSDALSIAFMVDEARRLAQGRMIYLILISDCAWNRSFGGEMTGQEEVRSYFETAHVELKGKLHTTLVALGVKRETGLEDLVDKTIRVSDSQLANGAAVAGEIGTYVASCLKERRKLA